MILVDTNALIDLSTTDVAARTAASRVLARIPANEIFCASDVVIAECSHFLHTAREFRSLEETLRALDLKPLNVRQLPPWTEVLEWLIRYGEHDPDYVDAQLVLLSASLPRCRVWTRDSKFRTIWRRPDGSKVPLV
jgi:predicted nucleic acid-binding protein